MLLPRSERSQAQKPAPLPLVRVVDDEPAIQALFSKLAALGGFQLQLAGTADELLQQLDDDVPGCLVLDMLLPDRSGIDLLQELSDRRCRLPVIFMSGMARVSEAVKALKLGSLDFLEKPFDLQEMLATIRRAIDVDAGNRRAGSDQMQLLRRFDALTPRESQVMEEIVRGAANKEVASKLGLSPKTVEVHRANVMRKTQAKSLAELVRLHVAVRS
jgi:two-component system, LuxR family, response regulator FixJ